MTPCGVPRSFVPIARAPMLVSPLVRFFDRGFQPHLDQMQHRSIDDPSSHRSHKLGVWNTIKVAAEIRINDLLMTRIDQLVDVFYCVQCAAVRPIGILLRLQVGLEDRFEYQHAPGLHNPISDCWYALTVSASRPAWVCKPAAQAAVDRFDFSALAPVRPTIVPAILLRCSRKSGCPLPLPRRWLGSVRRHRPERPVRYTLSYSAWKRKLGDSFAFACNAVCNF